MSTKRGAWIGRRGQEGAAAAIDQVLERQPQPGEPVRQLPDEMIEDSPYQARQPFSESSLAELAQGMRAAGFQGVLIVRPHGDVAKQRQGLMQLVYGHRRRAAWRLVCQERGEPCLLPVLVRTVGDAQMLLIGAQENLQRQDLDPLEEAQIVAWHERLFFDKNQAEIGALLGKSSDWVSVRSRIHKLPDALKERLRQRPRAIGQILELSSLYLQQPAAALELADRVVHENLTVQAIRTLIRDVAQAKQHEDREEIHNRRANATSVQGVTNPSFIVSDDRRDGRPEDVYTPALPSQSRVDDHDVAPPPGAGMAPAPVDGLSEQDLATATASGGADQQLLQEAVAALISVASHAEHFPIDRITARLLDQLESALVSLQRALVQRTLLERVPAQRQSYSLIDTDLHELLVLLHHHRPVVASLRPTAPEGEAIHLVLCLLAKSKASDGQPNTNAGDLFVTIVGAGNRTVPFMEGVPVEWVRNCLQLSQDEALSVAALISDLARGQMTLQALAQ